MFRNHHIKNATVLYQTKLGDKFSQGSVKFILCNRDIGRLVCNFQTFQLGPRGYSHVHIIPTDNLVPHACDPLEGTRGSGIIRFREESDWSLIWNVRFNFSQDSGFPASGNRLSQSLTFLPEDRRLGERD